MIGETTSAFYPKSASQGPSYHCFNSNCQGIDISSGNPFIFQNGAVYRLIQEQNVYATDYFWRKYYADLAMGFSRPIPTYFKQYCEVEKNRNVENIVVQQDSDITNLCGESKELFLKKRHAQIWRPFTPPTEIPCLHEDNFLERIETARKIPHRNQLSIIPSINQLDHSTSSVFVPVRKKSHFCTKCSAAFYSSMQLSNHMRMHTGSKPYGCDYPNCSKSFARNEELTRHRRIHSGYKPHRCSTCGKSFGRKDHLSKHLKTHLQVSEKKVYVCRVSGCGHRYTRSDALTRHKTNAHAIQKSKTVIEGDKNE